MQCWRGTDRRLHSSEYRAGEDEVRGGRRHVPDSQVVASSAAVDGSERGAIATFSFHCKSPFMHSNIISLAASLVL